MRAFETIIKQASDRHGGINALKKMLTPPKSENIIRKTPNDRWLAELTKCVFQAGFKWQIIEDKWERFEEVFENFNINRWAMMSDEDIDRLLMTEGIVKNYSKIRSVGANAMYLRDIIDSDGSVGQYFSKWKLHNYSDNIQTMQKYSSRLGGKTGQIFLRRVGVDTLVFTSDVIKRLTKEAILDSKMPGSKRQWTELQEALNIWHMESGYSLNEISQILAFSTD